MGAIENEPIRTAVIGVGHLGKEHARLLASLPGSRLVAVCDTNPTVGQAIAATYGTRYVADLRELLDPLQVDAVSIATPTVHHHQTAMACLRAGVHVMVEKPIARTLAEADEMVELADERGLVLQVGHIERFNPAFQALQKVLTRPRFFEAHRMGIFTPRSLDIDVVMDLMVHELDIIHALVGDEEVVRLEAVGIPILTRKIDLANARLEFANGCIANITASRVSGERLRKLRVFQPHEYCSLDYAEQQVAVCQLIPSDDPATLPNLIAGGLEVTRREPLAVELESFLTAVRTHTTPVVTGADGRWALRMALEVLEKIRAHAIRAEIGLHFE